MKNSRFYRSEYFLEIVAVAGFSVDKRTDDIGLGKFTIDAVRRKAIKLTANNTQYKYILNRHTRKAGQSLADNFKLFFGKKSDSKKMQKLSRLDKQGIKKGTALIGMSKAGVLFAMGQPPINVNPTTENNIWVYWRNRWGKRAIEFKQKGKVITIR